MTDDIFERTVVPVASPEDARATAAALTGYLDPERSTVVVVNVIEKAGGAPDKASVEQREEYARDIFAAFAGAVQDDKLLVETEVLYGTDVAETILEAAADRNATAIVFTPRGGNRWLKLITGDITLSLINEGDRPIVVLPDVELSEQETNTEVEDG